MSHADRPWPDRRWRAEVLAYIKIMRACEKLPSRDHAVLMVRYFQQRERLRGKEAP